MLLWFVSPQIPKEIVPEFASYQDVKKKKREFIKFISAKIQLVNSRILSHRSEFMRIYGKYRSGEKLDINDEQWLALFVESYGLASYDLSEKASWLEYSKRIDIVPQSMAIAQAAVESGWGTSRFAVDGNNYFGVWCYEIGCGMVPLRRVVGMHHEVRKYTSAQESVEHFIAILNTKQVYQKFRELRHRQRKQYGKLNGSLLIDALLAYSQLGKKYTQIVRQVIDDNDL